MSNRALASSLFRCRLSHGIRFSTFRPAGSIGPYGPDAGRARPGHAATGRQRRHAIAALAFLYRVASATSFAPRGSTMKYTYKSSSALMAVSAFPKRPDEAVFGKVA